MDANTHEHTCDKCKQVYYHSHPGGNRNHGQFSFQCPYPECEWAVGKGTPVNPRTKKEMPNAKSLSTKGSIPVTDNDIKVKKNIDYLGLMIQKWFNDGKIDCVERNHWYRDTSEKPPVLKNKSHFQIIGQMKTKEIAKCECQRKAFEQAWNSNTIGVYQDQYVVPGNYYKGIGKVDAEHKRKVMPVSFMLTEEQLKELHTRFPKWQFSPNGFTGHDHAISHVSNQVVSHNIMNRLGKGLFLDIFGNPKANKAFNESNKKQTRIVTMVNLECPGDYIRQATKWKGAPYFESKLADLNKNITDKAYDALVCHHALYYLDKKELVAAMNLTTDRMLYATMHRYVGESGELFNGEQKWKKVNGNKDLYLEQVNTHTGEKYFHKNNDEWFENQYWYPDQAPENPDENVGLAWTINMDAKDCYILTARTVPWSSKPVDFIAPPEPEPEMNSNKFVEKYNFVNIQDNNGKFTETIPVKNHIAFGKLRSKMVGRVRDEETLSTLANWTKMITKDYDIEAQDAMDIMVAAYWVDAYKYNKLAKRNMSLNLKLNKQVIIRDAAKEAFGLTAQFIRNTKGWKGVFAATADVMAKNI